MTSSRSQPEQNMSERRSWTSREIVKQYGIPLSNRVTETASRRQGTHGESRVVCKSRIVKSGVYYENRLTLIRMCHVLTRHEKIHDSRENKSFDYIDVTCYMIVLQNITWHHLRERMYSTIMLWVLWSYSPVPRMDSWRETHTTKWHWWRSSDVKGRNLPDIKNLKREEFRYHQ